MTELQKKILEIFKKFQKICAENDLNYFAIGGTCLGAIRHSGFIPWDDDIDVAMPIDDYEKFRDICRNKQPQGYELFDWEEKRHSYIKFLKLHDSSTTFIESGTEEMVDRYTGIFIDIMPIVGFPDEDKIKKRYFKKCIWYGRLNSVLRFEYRYKTTLKSKILYVLAKPVMLGKRFNYYSWKYEDYIKQWKFGETKRVLFPWRIPLEPPYKNVFPYEIFSESIEVPFEDTTISVPKEYDEYLKMDFGNYMQLPPEDKRHGGHPAAVIDFNKSYKVYQEERK